MAGILTYIIKFCVDNDFKVDDGIKKNIEGHWFWQLKQLNRNVWHLASTYLYTANIP